MLSHKFGWRRKWVFVHEDPTRSSHATSKKYVDAAIDNIIRNMKHELDRRFKLERTKLENKMRNEIDAALSSMRDNMMMMKSNRILKHSSVVNGNPTDT